MLGAFGISRGRANARSRGRVGIPRARRLELAAIAAARRNNASLWYVRNDLSNVAQNTDGSGAMTLNAPIGLLLDQRWGGALGVELLPAVDTTSAVLGTPGSHPGGWMGPSPIKGLTRTVVAKTAAYVDYRLQGTSTSTFSDFLSSFSLVGTSTTPDRSYRASARVEVIAGSVPTLSLTIVLQSGTSYVSKVDAVLTSGVLGSAIATVPTSGVDNCRIAIVLGGYTSDTAIDVTLRVYNEASFKEVLGTHATQATTANKPLLTRVPRTLGPELVADPNFDNPAAWGLTTSAGNTASVSGGVATVNSTDGGYVAVSAAGTTWVQPGKTYVCEFEVTAATGNGVRVDIGNVVGAYRTAAGTYRQTATAVNDYMVAVTRAGGVCSGSVTRLSVREVLEWSYAAQFDGSNDHLFGPTVSLGIGPSTLIAAGRCELSGDREMLSVSTHPAAGTDLREVGQSTNGFVKCSAGADITTGISPSAAPFVASEVFAAGATALYVNGLLAATSSGSESTGANRPVTIGSRNGLGQFWAGPISLACFCQGTMPDADRQAIERYAAYLIGAPYAA